LICMHLISIRGKNAFLSVLASWRFNTSFSKPTL
jgi:hypothetical protein